MLATIGTLLVVGSVVTLIKTKDKKQTIKNGYEQKDKHKTDVLDIFYSMSDAKKICSPFELRPLSGEGVWCSSNWRASIEQSLNHILYIAPCGAGKSRRFIIPNINTLTNSSVIVTDPVGEIRESYKGNKKVYKLNPFSDDSIGYDPLQNCNNEFEVKKLARIILMNGNSSARKGVATDKMDWIESAIPLVSSYLLYCWYCKRYTFSQAIENICTQTIGYLEYEIMQDEYESPKIQFKAFSKVDGSPATLASIRNVLNSCMQCFLDDNVRKLFSKPSIDFSLLRKEESILFIQIPERHAEFYSPLSATLMSQLFDILIDTEGLQVFMLFDEFCNVGKIGSGSEFCNILSTARKHGISISAAIQSLTQLYRTYNEIEGKELKELFGTIICSSGLKDSAEYISNLLGNTTKNVNGNLKSEPLMSPDEVRTMSENEVLIVCNNKRAVKDYKIKWTT
jgi:type IV secretory pathway TraG/TraD family ATPase VirD4